MPARPILEEETKLEEKMEALATNVENGGYRMARNVITLERSMRSQPS